MIAASHSVVLPVRRHGTMAPGGPRLISWCAMSTHAAMRVRCARLLRDMGVRPPMTLATLVDAVGARCGRSITLVPAVLDSGHDGLFGLTSPDPAAPGTGERISYQARTSVAHQMVIILHELAHILAEHPRRAVPIRPDDVRTRFDDLPDSLLHLVLGTGAVETQEVEAQEDAGRDDAVEVPTASVARTLYSSTAEWEAEAMARIMRGWITGPRDTTRSSPHGLSGVLGDPGRWA